MSRVYWKPNEVRALATRLVDHQLNPNSFGFVAEVRDYHQKQVLPEDRWRPVKSHKALEEVTKEMRRIEQERRQALQNRPAMAPMESTGSLAFDYAHKLVSERLGLAPTPAPKPADAGPARDPVLSALDVLADYIADRIIERLKLETETAPGGKMGIRDLLTPIKDRVRLKRILVIGLKPQQAAMINGEFSDRLDLRFVDSGAGASMVNQRIGDAELAIAMRFINHKHTDMLKGKVPFKVIHGGIDSLRHLLTELAG